MTQRHAFWRGLVVFAVLISAAVLAACGGGSSSSSSSSTVPTTNPAPGGAGTSGAAQASGAKRAPGAARASGAAGASTAAVRASLQMCLRRHGVTLPGGPAGGARRPTPGPARAAAFKACAGENLLRPRYTLNHAAINRFVACVRGHGYNMPSPNFRGGPVFPVSIRTDAKFQLASRTCLRLIFRPAP